MEQITYLVPNYNCARYVGETVRSLASQTSDQWRAIICDDCSTDDSVRVISDAIAASGVADRCVFVRNPTNAGCVGTLKRLIALADTDIVAILDADDSLAADATHAILARYGEHRDVGFVYAMYTGIDEQSQPIPLNSPVCSEVPDGMTLLVHGYVGAPRTFRRSVYNLTAGLDDEMLHAEDRDLVYKLEEVTTPCFIPKILYNYRFVRGSQSTDERKYRIGIRNHVRARRNALARRGVKGFNRLLHELINHCILVRSMKAPRAVTRSVDLFLKVLLLSLRKTKHSSGRISRRGTLDTEQSIGR